MAYALKFGTDSAGYYNFSNIWTPTEDPTQRIIAPSKLPRADGARQLTGYLDGKRLLIRGGVLRGPIEPSETDFRTQLDSFRSWMAAGPLNLHYGWADRYYLDAQVEAINHTHTRFGKIVEAEVAFLTPYPYEFSIVQSRDFWVAPTNGGTRTLTIVGNAYNYPIFLFDVGGTGGSQTFSWTLTNGATGEAFTLATAGSGYTVSNGNLISVDCLRKTVKIAGVDRMKLFDGQFPRLNVGANLLTLTVTSGTVASITSTWNERYWG